MNWRGIKAVMWKDLTVVVRSKMIMLTMILVPVIFMVVIPAGLGIAVNLAGEAFVDELGDFETMLGAMPPGLLDQFAGLQPDQLILTLMLVYMFAPFFLIVPLMVSSVIAADSFVGERERKTLEALLYTPLTDRELLFAKMFTAWLAAVVIGIVSFVLYALMANGVGWPVMGRIFFPNWTWIALVFWMAPAVAGLGLSITVVGSSRVSTFQEAYQFSSVLVLPVVLLIIGQMAGVVYLSAGFTLVLGLVVWVVDAVIMWFGVRTFDRDVLLSRL